MTRAAAVSHVTSYDRIDMCILLLLLLFLCPPAHSLQGGSIRVSIKVLTASTVIHSMVFELVLLLLQSLK